MKKEEKKKRSEQAEKEAEICKQLEEQIREESVGLELLRKVQQEQSAMIQPKGTAGSNRKQKNSFRQSRSVQKVLEQKKAREERLSDSEVKTCMDGTKEAYAAEQIQMEAYW